MPVTCKSPPAVCTIIYLTVQIAVEGKEYYCSNTRPDIPYTLYVAKQELLLVPREVQKIHPLFPTSPAPDRRIILVLSNVYASQFRSKYGHEPEFEVSSVGFGLDDDEVLVAGILQGTNEIATWEFRDLLNGDSRNRSESSSDVRASFGMMDFDLKSTARE